MSFAFGRRQIARRVRPCVGWRGAFCFCGRSVGRRRHEAAPIAGAAIEAFCGIRAFLCQEGRRIGTPGNAGREGAVEFRGVRFQGSIALGAVAHAQPVPGLQGLGSGFSAQAPSLRARAQAVEPGGTPLASGGERDQRRDSGSNGHARAARDASGSGGMRVPSPSRRPRAIVMTAACRRSAAPCRPNARCR